MDLYEVESKIKELEASYNKEADNLMQELNAYKKKVRQLQQQWNDEVTKLVADRNKAISDVMVDILTLIRMDIKSASSVLISHEAAKLLWEKAYEYGHANGFTDIYCAIENYEEVVIEALKGKEK